MKKTLLFLAALAFFLATPFAPAPWVTNVAAQTSLNQTTLTNAITDTSGQVVVVASATGVSAPGTNGSTMTYLFVDNELMAVRALSGTTATVIRGANGTRASTHAANAIVYVAPAQGTTTVDYSGSCTASNQTYLPIINIRNGIAWNCINSQWSGFNLNVQSDRIPRVSVAAAYTVLPTDYLVVLTTTSGASAVKSITLPSHVGLAGKLLIIKDESGGISATSHIVLVGTIDGTNSATASIIDLKTPFGYWMGYAGSGGWFTLSCGNGGGAVVSACR